MNAGRAEEHDGVAGAVPWAGLTLVLVPFFVAIVELFVIGGKFHAVGDQALDEMLTRDVGHHAVLLGPFARENWSHLGPAMFYALAVPYRLTGSNSVGLVDRCGSDQRSCCCRDGTDRQAARRHLAHDADSYRLRRRHARALGADFLRNPWNPYLPVFSFGALIFLVWAMACGDAWALPVGAAVATFCAQTHISYVILALPLFVGGAVWLTALAMQGADHHNVHPPSRRRLVRARVDHLGVLLVMWLPPVIEQFTRSPGNMSAVLRYFEHPPPGPRYSMLQGYRVVAGQFRITPDWVRGVAKPVPFSGEPVLLYRSPTPWLLAAFAAGGVVLWWRRRDRNGGDERGWRLAAIVTVTLVLGIVSIVRTVGVAYEYRVRWSLLVAMIATVTTAWAAWTIIERPISLAVRRVLMFTSLLVLGGLAATVAVDAIRAGTPQQPQSATVSKLASSALAALPPGTGDVLIESPDLLGANQAGLVLWFERHGVAARLRPAVSWQSDGIECTAAISRSGQLSPSPPMWRWTVSRLVPINGSSRSPAILM